jgi:hypothetical protein
MGGSAFWVVGANFRGGLRDESAATVEEKVGLGDDDVAFEAA